MISRPLCKTQLDVSDLDFVDGVKIGNKLDTLREMLTHALSSIG